MSRSPDDRRRQAGFSLDFQSSSVMMHVWIFQSASGLGGKKEK